MTVTETLREVTERELRRNRGCLVDCHTHVGFHAWNLIGGGYPTVQSVADLKRKMDKCSVGYSVAFPCPSDPFFYDACHFAKTHAIRPATDPVSAFPFQLQNATMLREVSWWARDTVLPFPFVVPAVRESAQLEALRPHAETGNVFGMKLHSRGAAAPLRLLLDSTILQFAAEFDLPMMLHTGPDAASNPFQAIELARKYPSVRFCAAHAGQLRSGFVEAVAHTKLPNLFVDCCPLAVLAARMSGSCKHQDSRPDALLEQLYEQLGRALLWGTDEPWTSVGATPLPDQSASVLEGATYEQSWSTLANASPTLRRDIAHDNPVRFLFG